MCSSENELIPDARQVHLEDMIMKNEEQFVMVRLPLSDEQVDKFCDGAEREMVVSRDDRKVAEAGIRNVAAPIPPCADVETVGWARDYVFAALKNPGCCAVSIHNEFEGGVPLVRRTDMEAQVARVVAEKDVEIERLWSALDDIEMGIDALPDDNEDYSKMSAREMRRQALEVVKAEVKALKGGAS